MAPTLDEEMPQRVADSLEALPIFVKEGPQEVPVKFGIDELRKSLKGYNKESIGIDIWSPSELRALPDIALGPIAEAIENL